MAAIIGQAVDRIDGPAKATGAAPYAGDVKADRMAFGVIVTATIGRGRITGINTDMARQMPGVLLVMTHQNAPTQAPFQAKGQDRHARPRVHRVGCREPISAPFGGGRVLHVYELAVCEAVHHAGLSAAADRPLAGLGQRRHGLAGLDADLTRSGGVKAVAGDRRAQVE